MSKATPKGKATPKAKAPKGGSVAKGIETAREYNESVRESGADVAPEGVVTWPTRYGNPDMSVPPATPTKIVDGQAVPVESVADAPTEGEDETE